MPKNFSASIFSCCFDECNCEQSGAVKRNGDPSQSSPHIARRPSRKASTTLSPGFFNRRVSACMRWIAAFRETSLRSSASTRATREPAVVGSPAETDPCRGRARATRKLATPQTPGAGSACGAPTSQSPYSRSPYNPTLSKATVPALPLWKCEPGSALRRRTHSNTDRTIRVDCSRPRRPSCDLNTPI